MGERSQFILDYPIKEEPPANMLYKYRKDGTEDELNDKIVFSKKQFHFEESSEVREDEMHLRRFRELAIESDSKFSQLVDIADPKDQDFNYSSVQKLSHEYFYEIIEDQLRKFKKTQQILDVFKKPNQLVNFFLSDFDPPTNSDAVSAEPGADNINNDPNQPQQNSRKESGDIFGAGYRAIALRETYSQGKDFFFLTTSLSYEVVKEYPDGVYVEVRNRDNPDQIGIFKKKDLQRINLNAIPSNESLSNHQSQQLQYPKQEPLKYQQQSQQQSVQQSQSSVMTTSRPVLDSQYRIESEESSRSFRQFQLNQISTNKPRSFSKKLILSPLKPSNRSMLSQPKKIL